MAKPTRKEPPQRRGPQRSASEAVRHPTAREGADVLALQKRLSLRHYLLMNGIFIGFCVAQLLFIRITLNEIKGLYFFFGLLIVGFAAVSLYDYVYDRMAVSDSDE